MTKADTIPPHVGKPHVDPHHQRRRDALVNVAAPPPQPMASFQELQKMPRATSTPMGGMPHHPASASPMSTAASPQHQPANNAGANARKAPQQGDIWSQNVSLKFLFVPLGDFTLELNAQNTPLISVLGNHGDWTIRLLRVFTNMQGAGKKFDGKLRPKGSLDAVAQRLFMSTPALHACIVVERRGFLWLNRFPDEPYVRVNWMEEPQAHTKILPPLNLCFDLDETLIFNAPVRGCTAKLEYVVPEPPHLLRADTDHDTGGEIPSSDMPFRRPELEEFLRLVCPYFRNIRVATFSVQSRAQEIVEFLDPQLHTLRKNHRTDPLTGQPPVATTCFAREALLQAGVKAGMPLNDAAIWCKSLANLDLPAKHLHEHSVVIDDRVDVWRPEYHDNVVKIAGPDRPSLVGSTRYLNGMDGGELGARIALSLINLQLRSAKSPAYAPRSHDDPLPAPARFTQRRSAGDVPALSPVAHLAMPSAQVQPHHQGAGGHQSSPNSPTTGSGSPHKPMTPLSAPTGGGMGFLPNSPSAQSPTSPTSAHRPRTADHHGHHPHHPSMGVAPGAMMRVRPQEQGHGGNGSPRRNAVRSSAPSGLPMGMNAFLRDRRKA